MVFVVDQRLVVVFWLGDYSVFKLKLKYKGKIMNVTYFDIWCFSALILYGVLRLVG